mgnify:CR=1 FL=1
MTTKKALRIYSLIFTTTLGISACEAQQTKPGTRILPIKELFSSLNCNINKASITAITDKLSLQETLNKTKPYISNSTISELASIDFNTSAVYLVAMGVKPNSGYSIKLTNVDARYEHGTLNLPLKVEQPLKGGMYAQMMTSPCILISLPSGAYNKVSIPNWKPE